MSHSSKIPELAMSVGDVISIDSPSSPYGNLRYKVVEITEDEIKLEMIKDTILV